MNSEDINDKRGIKDFKGVTFSNYKRADSKKALLNSLIEGKIEPSCYWSIEFICAGHFLELWDILLMFYSKYINIGNPKFPLYMLLRFNNFKEIIISGYVDNELKLRNNAKVRILFAEVITILCLSTKTHALSPVKVNGSNLSISDIPDKLNADSVNYGNTFFKKEDPKELFIAINEFVYNLRNTRNAREVCYWFEWILDYEVLCKKKNNNKINCSRRDFMPIENKYRRDIIWLIWEIILNECDKMPIKNIINALFELFCIKFKPNFKKKRRFLIYNAITFITNGVNTTIDIYTEELKITTIKKKINTIYKQVKKNELTPKTDYLFNNSIASCDNLENTIAKLETMDSFNTVIPRNK